MLELVEGPTLADCIASGSLSPGGGEGRGEGGIPVEDALPIAKQIAAALEAAHEAGVIQRDLKPANIKVREDGTVKVLDFGLAKAFQGEPGSDPSESPTMTAAATRAGVILGTAAYMSPEQAKGKPADRRADIWAFGCVLYEMLTGTRPFGGGNVSEVLAEVIKSEPDWEALSEATPATLRQVVRRCLQKDPRQRLHDVADLRLAMEGVAIDVTDPANRDVWILNLETNVLDRLTNDPAWDAYPVWTPDSLEIICHSLRTGQQNLFTTAANGTGVAEQLTESAASPTAHAVTPDGRMLLLVEGEDDLAVLSLEEGGSAVPLLRTEFNENSPALSPDGRWVAYQSDRTGQWEIYVRPFPVVEENRQQISASGGRFPLWAPDGQELYYMAGQQLTAVPVQIDPTFRVAGEPEPLFEWPFAGIFGRNFDIDPTGQRFLMSKPVRQTDEGSGSPQIRVVTNWFEELERLVPTP